MPAPKSRLDEMLALLKPPDAEIVDKMLALLKPPADQRERIRAKVLDHISSLQRHELAITIGYVLSPGRVREKLDDYLKALRQAARNHSIAVRLSTGFEWDSQLDFGERLDAQINHIKTLRDSIKVKQGRRPVDLTAEAAVQCALSYLCPQWYRKPIEQWPPVTPGKPWHQLSKLLYEAASGRSDGDKVLNYMGKLKDRRKKGKVLDVIGGLRLVG
jgi:uncharacterized protein YdbL (DUF1318 family)